jgi:integrase
MVELEEADYPMLRIPGGRQKTGKDELYPLTPDFAEFLERTPPDERTGPVFSPLDLNGQYRVDAVEGVSQVLASIGEVARVRVSQAEAKKIKHASAHDLRRSFGNRWAQRLMPAELKALMRHEDIKTTMDYYVDLEAGDIAKKLWSNWPVKTCLKGASSPTAEPSDCTDANCGRIKG